MSKNFITINICDFEYEVEPGGLPRVLCMVVYVLNELLQHVRTIRMWRGEFGSIPRFDNGPDAHNGDLVLAKYSNICEFGDSDGGQNDTIDYLK